MGQILEATCTCSFQARGLFVGGGMRNFETYCGAPALCCDCGVIHILNYLDRPHVCPHCGNAVVFYNDPRLFSLPATKTEDRPAVFSWHVPGEAEPFVLLDVDYLCPTCREMHLRFTLTGFWD